MLHSDGKVQPLFSEMLHRKAWSRQFCHICTAKYNLCPCVDLKAISFPIYPQLFCELFTNQYLMINGLGHVMQIQRDPVITCRLKKTFSSTCELSLVVKNSNWRQRQYCDVVKTSPSNLQTESSAATLHVAVVIFTLSQYRQNQPSDEGGHTVACEPGSG